MAKAKLLSVMGFCLLVLAIGAAVCFLTPYSDVLLHCRMCGKERATSEFLGCTWFDRERDTARSDWYQHKGLKPHDHQWVHLCSNHREWGGKGECRDSFGWELVPLDLLREVSEVVDQGVFDALVADYYAMRQDRAKTRQFVEKCEQLLSPTEL